MEKQIKKAFADAEQELQEKEVAQYKGIIKDLLQKKVDKEEEKREIDKEISVIKQTIDDFKAGRLDKVKELQEKDSVAKQLLPFKVIVINQPVYTQPWNWIYQVQNALQQANQCKTLTTGNNFATFTTGTYNVGGRIINL